LQRRQIRPVEHARLIAEHVRLVTEELRECIEIRDADCAGTIFSSSPRISE
jgi:hypothetical protein